MPNKDVSKILILGHSGFIGKHITSAFAHRDIAHVSGQSLPTMDLTSLNEAMKLVEYVDSGSTLIMCSGLKRNHGDNLDTFEANTKMVTNLCRVVEQNPVKRIIYLSSAAVYGEDIENRSINEMTAIHPTTYYGMSKFVSERLLAKTCEKAGTALQVLRPATVYGPFENIDSYSPSGFARLMFAKNKIILWGDGSELREFVFIDDLVNIICRLTFSDKTGVLNVASGQSHSFQDILAIIKSYGNLDIGFKERTKRKVDHIFDNKSLRNAFPDLKFTSLEDGIRLTIEREQR